jgi:phosphoribosylanthranilate isomerase
VSKRWTTSRARQAAPSASPLRPFSERVGQREPTRRVGVPEHSRQRPRARTRIKICGITTVEAALAAVDAGADALGLIFADGSPRRITIDTAADIRAAVPPLVTLFGVFQLTTPGSGGGGTGVSGGTSGGINSDLENWSNLGLWVQLHGDENEALARHLTRRFRVIKAFRYSASQVRRWDACQAVEMLLIDSPRPGSGRSFNLAPLAKTMREGVRKPVMLAGGLTPGNVADAIRQVRPYAVDVSTGVESPPGSGRKDPALIRAFCEAVRAADEAIAQG